MKAARERIRCGGRKNGDAGAVAWVDARGATRSVRPSMSLRPTMKLTEDNTFRSLPTSIFNGRIGYRFDNGWRSQLDALNLFNSRANQITYAYGSLIKSDALFAMCFPASGPPTAPAAVCQKGVMDSVLHPVEPLAVRVSLTGEF